MLNKLKNQLQNAAAPKKLSKEEKAEVKRQQILVKEVIYPIFLAHAKTVRDAKNVCTNFNVALDAGFYLKIKEEQQRLSGALFEELDLKGVLQKGTENSTEWALIEALKGEKIQTVKSLIEGMGQEIQRLIEKDIVDKPLDQLKTEFI